MKQSSSAAVDTSVSHQNDLLVLGFIMIAGALAFLWAGYRGNPTSPDRLSREPWTLFGYFCLVMLALELLVLLTTTPRPSRARIISTLAVTCLCIILVSVVYLTGTGHILTWIKERAPEIAAFLSGNKQLAFNVANITAIVILWLGIRFASYDPQATATTQQRVYPYERLVGDLLISTVLSLILSVAFFWPLWQSSTALATPGTHLQPAQATLTVCDLTFLPFATPCTLTTFDVSTIFMLDAAILPLIYLGIALSILLYSAYGEALRQFHEKQRAGEDAAFPAFPAVFWQVIYDIVNRRLRQLPNLLIWLRYFWPLVILAAVVLAGLASKAILSYLFNVGEASSGQVLWFAPWSLSGSNLALEFGAAAAVLVAMAATVLATTLQGLAKPPSTQRNGIKGTEQAWAAGWSASWPHVRFLVVTLASSYWALSIVFSIINELALIGVREYGIVTSTPEKELQQYYWAPFVQPDPLMVISLIVFVLASPRILTFLFSRSSARKQALGGGSAKSPQRDSSQQEG
jgi:hypothetical protein